MGSRLALSTELVLEQPRLHNETLSQKKKMPMFLTLIHLFHKKKKFTKSPLCTRALWDARDIAAESAAEVHVI